MPSRQTKPGTKKLSEVARHLVRPAGIASSGWPQVEKRCQQMGIGFDEWQRGAGRLILAKTADGRYAATVGGVGMSLPRQVGKTYLIGAIVFALCVDQPGITVIWTAHHSRTAGETFLSMQAMAKRRKIAPYVRKIYTQNGAEEVRFVNGSRVLFGARERGFGRGFAGVDVLVCDEAQILTDRALDNMLATMNTAANALPLFMGTPPTPMDPSESFERMRVDALSGDSDDTAWIECGADPGASPDDRKQWAKANPSYPHRTPVSSMLRLRKKLKPTSWLREGLGIWDDDARRPSVLPEWPDLASRHPGGMVTALGVGASQDGAWGAILKATLHGEVVHLAPHKRAPDTGWIPAVAKKLQDRHGCPVVVDEKCPDATLAPALEAAGVDVTVMKLADYVEAWSSMKNRARGRQVTHSNAPSLNNAVSAAVPRSVGDGRTLPGRKASADDIDMLEAAIAALHGAESGANYDVLDSIG